MSRSNPEIRLQAVVDSYHTKPEELMMQLVMLMSDLQTQAWGAGYAVGLRDSSRPVTTEANNQTKK